MGRGLQSQEFATGEPHENATHGIARRTYALAVIHDENMNGKLDANPRGIPTEGYGFSNDAEGFLGALSFRTASFAYDGQNVALTISLNY